MKVAAVCQLPFHQWVLTPLADAFSHMKHKVQWFVHHPQHRHDWLNIQHSELLQRLRDFSPDVTIVADYPYDLLREVGSAPVVGVRHSLAARGNTWEKAHSDADWIVTWSDHDEVRFLNKSVRPRQGFVRGGCTFAAPFLNRDANRASARRRLRVGEAQPCVLWLPTWNAAYNCADSVLEELKRLEVRDWKVLVRPHGYAQLKADWFETLDSLEGPWDAVAAADVLVSDVSGSGLFGLCVPGCTLPCVSVDPPEAVLKGSPQYDPMGPEWVFRNALGPRSPQGHEVAELVVEAYRRHAQSAARRHARDTLLGPESWTRAACKTTAQEIAARIGIGEPSSSTS